MIGSSPSHQSDEQLSYFLCTCGAEFELYHEYYNHLMQEMGMSQQKTIHRQQIQRYSNCSIASAGKFENELMSKACQEQTILEDDFKEHEEDLKQETSEDEQSIQSDRQSAARSSFASPMKEKRRYWKSWNDFLLMKNHKCKERPFYCGNCEIIYFQIEDFVSHCVQQCHTFEHPASSHFITDDNQQNKRNNMSNKKQQGQKKISLPQYAPIMNNIQCEPFNEIFRYRLDHRDRPLYCGFCKCNFRFFKSYNRHIIEMHQEKADPSSSHVILQFATPTQKKTQVFFYLYLSPHLKWINQQKKYYCPCQLTIKTTMAELLKHIQEAHNGFSPIYLGKFKRKANKQTRTKINEINKVEETDYSQFKRIYDNRCDHRNIYFFCGECLFKTKNPIHYIRHMKHYSHGSKFNRSSHVILRVINKREKISNIYLSPAVEWENEEAIYFCACDVHKKMKMKDLIQHVYAQHNGISPYYPLNSIYNFQDKYDQYFYDNVKDETIKSIIALHTFIIQTQFKCELCNIRRAFSPSQYAKHIMCVHNKTVDPKYHSHILIHAKYDKQQLTHYFYLPLKSKIKDDSLKYYCPCQTDNKMNLNGLIDHILKEHNGVSPSYSLD